MTAADAGAGEDGAVIQSSLVLRHAPAAYGLPLASHLPCHPPFPPFLPFRLISRVRHSGENVTSSCTCSTPQQERARHGPALTQRDGPAYLTTCSWVCFHRTFELSGGRKAASGRQEGCCLIKVILARTVWPTRDYICEICANSVTDNNNNNNMLSITFSMENDLLPVCEENWVWTC